VEVALRLDQPVDRRMPADARGAAVRGEVVDDDDLVAGRALLLEALEDVADVLAVTDDDQR